MRKTIKADPDLEKISSSSLYSEDLAPIPQSKRTWNTWYSAALWISMSLYIPKYMLARASYEWFVGFKVSFVVNIILVRKVKETTLPLGQVVR
ncbi:MAG: hypothetical protein SGI89_00655 [bacterium]|nr:hypothetical protein [bacterium]